jgi:hypothetical protein
VNPAPLAARYLWASGWGSLQIYRLSNR